MDNNDNALSKRPSLKRSTSLTPTNITNHDIATDSPVVEEPADTMREPEAICVETADSDVEDNAAGATIPADETADTTSSDMDAPVSTETTVPPASESIVPTAATPPLKPWERPNYRAFMSVSTAKNDAAVSGAGCLTAVNSLHNGKRLEFSQRLIHDLGDPARVKVACVDNELLVGAELPDNDVSYAFRQQGAKYILYAANLVKDVTRELNLNYSNNRVCITFYNYTLTEYEGSPVAVIDATNNSAN